MLGIKIKVINNKLTSFVSVKLQTNNYLPVLGYLVCIYVFIERALITIYLVVHSAFRILNSSDKQEENMLYSTTTSMQNCHAKNVNKHIL